MTIVIIVPLEMSRRDRLPRIALPIILQAANGPDRRRSDRLIVHALLAQSAAVASSTRDVKKTLGSQLTIVVILDRIMFLCRRTRARYFIRDVTKLQRSYLSSHSFLKEISLAFTHVTSCDVKTNN